MTKESVTEERQLFLSMCAHRHASDLTARGVATGAIIGLAMNAEKDCVRAAASRWLWRQHQITISPLGAPAPKVEAL
ncbi:hypothetical protein T8K17_11415 [Thalassobaculum sp. OXR-137]|uniref:hypothetical protein n=1 Tax=Thalassobaculum sp. OXR-137 TaxID=3100173 RepID=UPI002AC9EE45|nr:hypothetical protein [Thalassobaculum sp. OXR-137]WPZ36743.1 hypothetical protein T8K17_11415 [Thalassobaculum sp. OXR-137]